MDILSSLECPRQLRGVGQLYEASRAEVVPTRKHCGLAWGLAKAPPFAGVNTAFCPL